ncbi:hypothetical protein [Roseibium sp. SCP14]|uniref:hypothetical protein n=1 Tax=Roseibium sp. SCP14 TaxID=3141375 RepID=UPI00333BD60A
MCRVFPSGSRVLQEPPLKPGSIPAGAPSLIAALGGNNNAIAGQYARQLAIFNRPTDVPENCLFLVIIAPPILSAING